MLTNILCCSYLFTALWLVLPLTSHAAQGTIGFTGQITTTTCALDVNGSGSGDGTVSMPPVPASELTDPLSEAGWTTVYITVSQCNLLDPPAPHPPIRYDSYGLPNYHWSGVQQGIHQLYLWVDFAVDSGLSHAEMDHLLPAIRTGNNIAYVLAKNLGTTQNVAVKVNTLDRNPHVVQPVYYKHGFAKMQLYAAYRSVVGHATPGTVLAHQEYTI